MQIVNHLNALIHENGCLISILKHKNNVEPELILQEHQYFNMNNNESSSF